MLLPSPKSQLYSVIVAPESLEVCASKLTGPDVDEAGDDVNDARGVVADAAEVVKLYV